MELYSQHLSDDTLVNIAEGRMDISSSANAQAHLAGCEECRSALSQFQSIVRALRNHELVTPPQQVTRQALQIFSPKAKPLSESVAALRAGLQSLVAVLRFDSGLTPAYGMRSGPAQARQLFYTVNEFDIDLRLAPRAGEWAVEGQLLGGNTEGTVELASAGRRYDGDVNELGEFAFAGVRPDSYRLRITLPGLEISIPQLVLTK